ncbi:uncharacterized protein J3R85_001269 [Psidium guajava]|nr:uncharacterized protein J3R85_001269 [Psidium guajava]
MGVAVLLSSSRRNGVPPPAKPRQWRSKIVSEMAGSSQEDRRRRKTHLQAETGVIPL